ncbi:MAG: endolytic transglycosylase MltG [Patescibacteria group bacterium]
MKVLPLFLIFIFGTLILAIIFLRPLSPTAESNEITITIPEGYTVQQIGELFDEVGTFSKDDFVAAAIGEEGFLFPDTYRFFKNTTPTKAIEKMKKNFENKTKDLFLNRDTIIMASIIEKEVSDSKDRRIVSGILWKRIERGIGLQVDAALTYILGKRSDELTGEDLSFNSPYNTYKYRGFPAGPIANPGLDAILAALNPETSPYLFYLSDENGITRYARNFDEHKENKLQYLR